MILDHEPIPIDEFNGLFGIDSYNDSVPANYFINELNTITHGGELKSRDGFAISDVVDSVLRWVIYRRQGEAARILVLNNSEQIVDLTTATVILEVADMIDFAIWFFNGRAFISPHNGISGLPGEFVYVYNGSGTARKAAGLGPVAGFTATISATAGNIEAGTHLFAWSYETDSGFITPPSPAQTLEFDGSKTVSFSNIPVGPAGTAARRLLVSRAIADYNGNEEGYEMFFVPGGRINNNTDTVLSNLDFFDEELVDQADYIYDQLEEIPAVVFISPYGRRICYGGPDSDKNLVYVSKMGEPESIGATTGFISFDPHETEGVKDATEFRDNLYVVKPNRTYTVRDNTYEPSTWIPVSLDKAIGGNVNSIAQYLDSKGARVEFFVVADTSGLYKFSGVYEEIPLTRNIKNWWQRINKNYIHKLQVIIDQESFLIYILVPLDGAISPNYIIVGNFENGFQWDRIKWHLWNITGISPSSIGVDVNPITKKNVFKFGSLSGNIYAQEVDRRNDDGNAINQVVRFALVGSKTQAIHHFGAVGLRVKGSGTLGLKIYNMDDTEFEQLANITLSATQGQEILREASLNSEKASLELTLNSFGSYFKLRRANVYVNVIFNSWPNLA